MAGRSLGSQLAIGSLLWTLGVIAIVVALAAGPMPLPAQGLSPPVPL